MSASTTPFRPLRPFRPLMAATTARRPLAPYFSELALIRYRVLVEVEYFIALCELPLPQLTGVIQPRYFAAAHHL